jgi:hypothetical protein
MEEFVDQLNFIQDIFFMKLENLNTILRDELIKRFLVPICITSICKTVNVILFKLVFNQIRKSFILEIYN